MIEEQAIATMNFESIEYPKQKIMAYVTDADMHIFKEMDDALRDKIKADVIEYKENNKLRTMKEALVQISMETRISVAYLNKAMNNGSPSREFLYMYVIGMKKFKGSNRQKAIERANEYFELKGGALTDKCKLDFICLCALRDNDDINVFFEQCKKYTKLPFIRKERALNKRIEAELSKKGF